MHRMMFTAESEASGKILALQVSNQPKQRLRHLMGPQHRGICVFSFFGMDNLANLTHRVTRAGFEVVAAPADVDGERMMVIRGPNGEFCELTEWT